MKITPTNSSSRNVILITLDGLRPDMLGSFLKTLCSKGMFFPEAITAAPYTVSSLHSVFSGLLPREHGLNGYYKLLHFRSELTKTLTQYLKEQHFYTFADVLNKKVIPTAAFDTVVETKQSGDAITQKHLSHLQTLCSQDKPFFFYAQYAHIHNELIEDVAKKHDDFSEDFFDQVEENIKRYQTYVSQTEKYVSSLMNFISSHGLKDNTLIIFHSDHGASLGEKKGEKMYGSYLFDYTLKSFLLVMGPGIPSKTVLRQARQIDILPTVLSYLGIPFDEGPFPLRGKSLFLIDEERHERASFSETGGLGGPWPSSEKHNLFCVRHKQKKLIYNSHLDEFSCYDLTKDPLENEALTLDFSDKEFSSLFDLLIEVYPEIYPQAIASSSSSSLSLNDNCDGDLIEDF